MGEAVKAARAVIVLAALTVLQGCASAGAPATHARSNVITIDSGAFLSLAMAGDSLALAEKIRGACHDAAEKSECVESLLEIPASRAYVKVAMGALGSIVSADPDIRRSSHVYAHAIGIAAGKGKHDIAAAFSQCSESFQSGCYHGIIQAYFAGLDSIGAADANALCAPFRLNAADRWLRFQCVHGMGHGLTMLYDHDLPKGLAGCDLLTDWWDRHSCYSGAFMENIVNVTIPHHPASAFARHSMAGMEDHDMEGMDMPEMQHASSAFKPVDPSDQQYPCSIMAERYLSACYEMQTSVMLYNNKGNIAGAAVDCDSAPLQMRPVCFSSLGRDISSYSQQQHREAIRLCSLANPKYQPFCYNGVVKNFIDLEARPQDGLAFCRDVPGEINKAVCYNAVGEQLVPLRPEPGERRSVCAASEDGYIEACLYGARIPGARAPGMLQKFWASLRS